MHGRDGRGLWPRREAERREERRAAVLLQGGLQRLDEARTYHINTLTREQRRLHKDLLNIKTGNPWRRNLQPLGSRPLNPEPDHLAIPYRTTLPKIPRVGREPEKHRSPRAQCGGVSCPEAALQARVHEFICSAADTPGAESSTAPLCLPDLKLQAGDKERVTHTKTAERKEELGMEERTEGERKTDKQKEREEDHHRYVPPSPPPPSPIPPPPPPLESLAPDGRPRTLHLLPDFVQSLAEARKARYIRYRGRPPCERELSITEIFARSNADSAHGS